MVHKSHHPLSTINSLRHICALITPSIINCGKTYNTVAGQNVPTNYAAPTEARSADSDSVQLQHAVHNPSHQLSAVNNLQHGITGRTTHHGINRRGHRAHRGGDRRRRYTANRTPALPGTITTAPNYNPELTTPRQSRY